MSDDGASRRLSVMAEASFAFASVVTDSQRLLDEIARLTADRIGDGCTVTLVAGDGESLYNAASAHRDRELESIYRQYLAGMGVAKTSSATVSAEVVRTGAAKLVPVIAPEALVARTDEALRPLVARLNVHSFCVVAIRARGAILGTLSVLRSGPGNNYTAEDLAMVGDLADRAGLAIANARLYDDLDRRVRERTAELEAANRELIRSNDHKSRFLAYVSHELRTPLNAILGFAELLHDGVVPRDAPEASEFLGDILDSGRHLLQMVNDLLDLSKVEAGKLDFAPARISVSAVVDEVVGVLHPVTNRHGSRIETALADDADDVVLDPARLRQILYNYISNAIKFTPKGGCIAVRTSSTGGEMIRIEVEDSGIGISAEDLSRLFADYRQTGAGLQQGGTGLGLALTKRIVEAQGGSVGVSSQPGRGTVFHAVLPRRMSRAP